MKDQYTADDFTTSFGKMLAKDSPIDYALLENEDIRNILLGFAVLYTGNKGEKEVPVNRLVLADGRRLSAQQIEDFLRFHSMKTQLDAIHFFESFFEKNKDSQALADQFTNADRSIPETTMLEFTNLLCRFPAEATFIRTEIVYHEIHRSNDVYNRVMGNIARNLARPMEFEDGKKFPPVGPQAGPRIPPLDIQMIAVVLKLWQSIDAVLGPTIRLMSGATAMPASEREN